MLDLFISGHIHPETQISKDALSFSGVSDFMIELAIRQSEYDGVNSQDERIAAIVYLSEFWQKHLSFVEERPQIQELILNVLKKVSRDNDKLIRVVSIEHLFILLEIFANDHHSAAPLLYKQLTFLLVEYHMELEMREQVIKGFMAIFNDIPSIPV
jgi:hypothetical protein